MTWRGRHLDRDSLWPFASVRAALAIGVVTVASTCALVACNAPVVVDATPTSPGRPLDAVRYEAPTFAEGEQCFRVVDRASGSTWWLVQMRDGYGKAEWIVLPIATGKAVPNLWEDGIGAGCEVVELEE